MTETVLPPAIFVMGTTASGKTALAVELVKRLPVEIISVDSGQKRFIVTIALFYWSWISRTYLGNSAKRYCYLCQQIPEVIYDLHYFTPH